MTPETQTAASGTLTARSPLSHGLGSATRANKKKRDRKVALTKFGDLFPSTKKSASESSTVSIAIRSALITRKSRNLLFQIPQQCNFGCFPLIAATIDVAHSQRRLVDTSRPSPLFRHKSLYIKKNMGAADHCRINNGLLRNLERPVL
ncbi:hypothetical protein [Caballeronia catudaia]|uniref:hypothetical protein n=1 Tax=Caballeronia catudaia TaxID=1777136 RepID=UPI00117C1437|nr:hypothetical protein [Caballeronia catudaia]